MYGWNFLDNQTQKLPVNKMYSITGKQFFNMFKAHLNGVNYMYM